MDTFFQNLVVACSDESYPFSDPRPMQPLHDPLCISTCCPVFVTKPSHAVMDEHVGRLNNGGVEADQQLLW